MAIMYTRDYGGKEEKRMGRGKKMGGAFFVPLVMLARVGMMIYRGYRIYRLARAALAVKRVASAAAKLSRVGRGVARAARTAAKRGLKKHVKKKIRKKLKKKIKDEVKDEVEDRLLDYHERRRRAVMKYGKREQVMRKSLGVKQQSSNRHRNIRQQMTTDRGVSQINSRVRRNGRNV